MDQMSKITKNLTLNDHVLKLSKQLMSERGYDALSTLVEELIRGGT